MLEFNKLNIDNKSELLWEWGYYITSFKSPEKNTVIFSLGTFLAEVQYSLPGNRLENIKGISSEELPVEYFNHVKSSPFIKMVRRIDAGNYIKKLMKR